MHHRSWLGHASWCEFASLEISLPISNATLCMHLNKSRFSAHSMILTQCMQALGALLLIGFLVRALGQSFPFASQSSQSSPPAGTPTLNGPQLYSYDIIETYPHDPNAFTQGLEYDKVNGQDAFWESTGSALTTSCQNIP